MSHAADANLLLDAPVNKPALWTLLPRALWPVLLAAAIGAVMHFIVAPRIGIYRSNLVLIAGIYMILAASLTVVNGFTGQFSIGHAGFMSIGGYVAGALMYYGSHRFFGNNRFHGGLLSFTTGLPSDFDGPLFARGDWLFLGAVLAAGLVAAILGWVVGLPSLRLRGDYLAIVTLGFGEIVRVILQGSQEQLVLRRQLKEIPNTPFPKLMTKLGGAVGLQNVPTYGSAFWVWTFVFVTLAAIIRLKYSSYGRALLSVREDEIASQAMGVNITRYKVNAFVFSSFFAGVAGALYVAQLGLINSAELAFQKSFDIVIMVVLGGMGSVTGAAIAAIILTILPELLREPPSIWPWGLLGAAVIAALVLLLAPRKRGPLITLVVVCVLWEAMRWLANHFGINLAEYRMIIYA